MFFFSFNSIFNTAGPISNNQIPAEMVYCGFLSTLNGQIFTLRKSELYCIVIIACLSPTN